MNIKKKLREALNKISTDFIVGKCYDYDELSEDIQYDIDVQFKIYDEYPELAEDKYDGYPEDYKYCFRYLKPNEIIKYLPLVKDILKSHKSKPNTYLLNLMNSIEKEGLNYPSVGTEGNHRGAVFYLLNKELPYLEIVQKKY